MKVLFMYTELPGYFSNCIELLYQTSGATITVVYYPNSSKAPFEHELPGIHLVNRKVIRGKQLIDQCLSFSPDLVYVAGWVDKEYSFIARQFKRQGSVVVCGLDNVWKGTIRQRLACAFSPVLIKPYFNYLWVAGHRQYQFARRLGYSYEKILTGLYAANVEEFKTIAKQPHKRKLVYAGRFEPEKGVQQLYDVFANLTESEKNGWTLDLIGNGSLKGLMPTSPSIHIHDFMQPKDLITFVADAGGFILPSHNEPWGVVVQEFAAAGKPLLLSSAVNSGEEYLIHGYNGYKFKAGIKEDLKAHLINFFSLNDETRNTMGHRSAELALLGEPKLWVARLLSLIVSIERGDLRKL